MSVVLSTSLEDLTVVRTPKAGWHTTPHALKTTFFVPMEFWPPTSASRHVGGSAKLKDRLAHFGICNR